MEQQGNSHGHGVGEDTVNDCIRGQTWCQDWLQPIDKDYGSEFRGTGKLGIVDGTTDAWDREDRTYRDWMG